MPSKSSDEESCRSQSDQQDLVDRLILVADQSGLSFDVLFLLSRGLDERAFIVFCGNAASMPRYMKSIVAPNLSQNTST